MSCLCQRCKKSYKVDLNIPNALWEKVRGGKNLLCGRCILEKIEELNNYNAYKLVELNNGNK